MDEIPYSDNSNHIEPFTSPVKSTMGLFGFWSSPEEKRKEEVRTGARAPDRTERKQCWDARDSFYRCLDKHDVIDSVNGDGKKIAEKQCAQENKAFEQNCASAWVSLSFSTSDHRWLDLGCVNKTRLTYLAGDVFQAVPSRRTPEEKDTRTVREGGRKQDGGRVTW